MTAGPAELAALARKYRTMAELRRTLPLHPLPDEEALDAAFPTRAARGVPAIAGETPEERTALRALAAEFPGALRELDTLATDEIDRRRAALEQAAAGGAVEPWMQWMHGYHAIMRAALAIKRRLRGRDSLAADERAHLEADAGAPVDEELVRAVAAPPHGRLNVVVFERLAARHGVPAKTIWDALYPPRAGERGYRR